MPCSANKSLSHKIQITVPLTVIGFPQLIGASLGELLMQSMVGVAIRLSLSATTPFSSHLSVPLSHLTDASPVQIRWTHSSHPPFLDLEQAS